MNSRSLFPAELACGPQLGADGVRDGFGLGVRWRHDDARDASCKRLHVIGRGMAAMSSDLHLAHEAQAVQCIETFAPSSRRRTAVAAARCFGSSWRRIFVTLNGLNARRF